MRLMVWAALAALVCSAAQAAAPPGYTLVWRDEFVRPSWADDHVAAGKKWSNHLWYRGGNGPLDIPSPSALSVVNGQLVITCSRGSGGKFYGGTLSSVNDRAQGFAQRYGYWEMRAKMAPGNWMLSSLYLISQPHMIRVASPPDPFEIDAVEHNGVSPSIAATTVHWYTGGQHFSNEGNNTVDAGLDLSRTFHTYGMEWTPTVIRFFLDGRVTKEVATPPDGHVPMGMMIVLYLTSWGGGADAGTPDQARMYVDWIRVYAPPAG